MLPVEWLPSSLEDLEETLHYIRARSPKAAERIFALMEEALSIAAERPYVYKRSERVPGLREIVVHPNYLVLYEVTIASILVVNVTHTSRDYP